MDSNQDIKVALKNLYEESEHRVKTDAIISRAYTDKISAETINEKVEAQMNAIKIGIQEINPRFKEGSKNYDTTKSAIVKVMADYEQALKELSEFYDGKIEQLILRKVELEASLVGSLINQEYLFQNEEKGKVQKNEVKTSISSTIKKVFEKITNKKQEKREVDLRLLQNMQDGKDVEQEVDSELENKIEKTKQEQKQSVPNAPFSMTPLPSCNSPALDLETLIGRCLPSNHLRAKELGTHPNQRAWPKPS